jgi:hypothetical protein
MGWQLASYSVSLAASRTKSGSVGGSAGALVGGGGEDAGGGGGAGGRSVQRDV